MRDPMIVAGAILVGLGLGMLVDKAGAGAVIGAGVGILIRAVLHRGNGGQPPRS